MVPDLAQTYEKKIFTMKRPYLTYLGDEKILLEFKACCTLAQFRLFYKKF